MDRYGLKQDDIMQGNITKETEGKDVMPVSALPRFNVDETIETIMSGAVSDKTVDRAYALSEQRNRQLFQELTRGSE